MRLLRRKIVKQYEIAQKHGNRQLKLRPYLLPIFGVLLGFAVIGGVILTNRSSLQRPSSSHVVFLFDNGHKETLDTKATTVAELVSKLPLHLQTEDVIEPAPATQIVQDNFRVNIYRARPVTVIDGGTKTVVVTAQKSPRVVAQAAGLTVYPEDYVNFSLSPVSSGVIGDEVLIDRSTPVALNLYGTPLNIRTHAKTIADLLTEKSIKLGAGDTVQPALTTPITAGLQMYVLKPGSTVTTVTEVIPTPVQIISDPNLTLGSRAVRQYGSAGSQVVTYLVTPSGRSALQTVVVQAAVPEIIVQGTNIDISGDKTSLMAGAGIAASDYGYADYIISHESGWCATKAQGEHTCPVIPDNSGTSYGYGLCQSTPGYKMASAGADWATNPITQLKWCSGYANNRYDGWYNAYTHWINNGNW